MSWTSEHDPPSSRPPDDDDLGAELGSAEIDIPDDGPLDPSVFDGLFDDLADDRSDEVDDNPLDEFLAVTLTGDLDDDLIRPQQDLDEDDTDVFQTDLGGPDDAATGPTETDGSLADDQPLDDGQADTTEARDSDGSFATATASASPDSIDDEGGSGIAAFDHETDLLDGPVDLDEPADLDHPADLDAPVDLGDPGDLDGPVEVDADLDELGQPLPPAMPSWDEDGDQTEDARHEPGGFFDVDPLEGPAPLEGDDATTVSLGLSPVGDESRLDLLPIEPDFDDPDGFDEFDLELDADAELEAEAALDFGPDDGVMADAGQLPAARPEDGPVRASPPIQHDPRPEPELVHVPPVEEEPIPAPVGEQRSGRSQRVLLALAAAIVVGGGLGVGGAMLLSRIIDRGDSSPATAAAAGAGAGTDENTETAAATEDAVAADSTGPATSLQITSLRFAGDGSLSVEPSPSLDLLSAAIERSPAEPIVATIRTFTEATADADLALSRSQAEALTTDLIELGADPEQVSVVGLGRSLLSGAQPVPNFVVPSAGLEQSPVAEVAHRIGPFAIGLDPATGQLRAESVAALDALAGALAADPDGRALTLAAYNFDQPDRAANEGQARLVGEAAVARLTEAGIDPARLTTIIAGDEPFAVPDRVANHIDLTWGTGASAPLAIDTLAIDRIDFAEGSSDLGPEAAATVDELARLLIESKVTAVIDVHSFDGVEVEQRVDLSVARAQTIGQRLLGAGVPASQLRLHGGTSSQFRGEDRICRVVVTALQPPGLS